jgi:hypothetical protein
LRRGLVAVAISGIGFWVGAGVWLYFGGTPLGPSLIAALIGLAVWPLLLAALAGSYRVAARILDGEGSWRRLYVGLAFGALPLGAFVVPAAVLSPIGPFWVRVAAVIGVGLLLWTLLLWAYAIREAYGLLTEFAFVALAMPVTFVVLGIAAVAISVGIGTLIIGSF